jgi:8-oxo-dGTP pyrophosphatase MutT (NUDIX family)
MYVCYNTRMNLHDTQDVVQALRERLEPLERAGLLIDTLEGQRPHARKAAVLICLFDQHAEPHLVFIRRATTLRSHSGEIAFPGGSVDLVDASPGSTALREAQEEIGLDPARVELLGIMPPVFTVVSNFLITPVVAYLPRGPGALDLQPGEVAELLVFPLKGLVNPAIYHTEEWTRGGMARTVYFFDYGSYRIWGATARMLHALLELLRN